MPTPSADHAGMNVAPHNPRVLLWRQAFRQRSVWLRALRLGLSVGLLQAVVNQGDHWLSGSVSRVVLLKSIVSPLIGFALVLVSAAETWVQRTQEQLQP